MNKTRTRCKPPLVRVTKRRIYDKQALAGGSFAFAEQQIDAID
jgi:hypothetical protein